MSSNLSSSSLQRTDSTGQLNVFIVLRLKSNDSLKIISREDLSPALRNGRLVLQQRIIIRDEGRNSIEGDIVYMHPDREQCVFFQKRQTNALGDIRCSTASSLPNHSTSRPSIVYRKETRADSNHSHVPVQKSSNQCIKFSCDTQNTRKQSKSSCAADAQKQTTTTFDDDFGDRLSSSENDLTATNRNASPVYADLVDDDPRSMNESTVTTEFNNNDIYLDKIKSLSLKVNQQSLIIKEKDALIKSLRSTMIEMPREQETRDYLFYMSEKIRQQTTDHKYLGNLANDAGKLGIRVEKLNEILKLKHGITSIARDIFKTIIPESDRDVDNWNKLSEHVFIKEKLLIDFLVRYFGPLEVEPKKVHISLVGCLRNHRGVAKKQKILSNSAHQNTSFVDKADECDESDSHEY